MAVWDKHEGCSPFFSSDDDPELYELKRDDSLFKADPKSGVLIYVDSPLVRHSADRPEWGAYVWGFKEAADRLVEDLVVEGVASMHTTFLANPILSLYRHSVELAIKSILITSGAEPKLFKNHDLNRLWQRAVEAMLNEDSSAGRDGWLTIVGNLIEELNEVDANSENFRYGVDKELQPYERRIANVDVVNLRRVMNKLASALESCDTWLYENQRARWERQAEYYPDMAYGSPSDYST